jgi:hypothetical protein
MITQARTREISRRTGSIAFLGLGIGNVAVPATRHGPPSRARPLVHARAIGSAAGLVQINQKKKVMISSGAPRSAPQHQNGTFRDEYRCRRCRRYVRRIGAV